jgi:predicted TIM-barrel enzyme
MKMPVRLLSMVLVLSIFFSGVAFSENRTDSPFAEETTETLYTWLSWIEAEIARREDRDKEVPVPVGIYVVGYDIPIGTYTIICNKGSSYIRVADMYNKTVLSEAVSKGERIGKIDLKYGYTVEICTNPVVFAPYKGLGF